MKKIENQQKVTTQSSRNQIQKKNFGSEIQPLNCPASFQNSQARAKESDPIKDWLKLSLVDRIKLRLEASFFKNQKWRACGVQLTLPYSENEQSLLDKMFDVKNRVLLHDVHALIYRDGFHHEIVFVALRELLAENNLLDAFSDWMSEPIDLLSFCLEEFERRNQQQTTLESFLSLSLSKS